MMTLLMDAVLEVPVSNKRYVERLCSFDTEVQAARRQTQAASRELEVENAKVGELKLKV